MTDNNSKPETEMSALTSEEGEGFNDLMGFATGSTLEELPDGMRVGLMRARLDGEDVALVILAKSDNQDGSTDLSPLALLMNDDLFARIEAPA